MKYLNAKKTTFKHFNNSFGSSVEARITPVQKRFLLWKEDGQLAKERPCYDETQIPQGWRLAYDLDLEMNNASYRFTIHEDVIHKAFKPYGVMLRNQGKRMEDVRTRITTFPGPRGKSFFRFEEVASSDIPF